MITVKTKMVSTHAKQTATSKKAKGVLNQSPNEALEISAYYGFKHFIFPHPGKSDFEKANEILSEEGLDKHAETRFQKNLPEKIALLRHYEDKQMYRSQQPILLASTYSSSKTGKKRERGETHRVCLEILGSGKSIAEATLIETALQILALEGNKNLVVELNSLGDKESSARFVRELTAYYRKNISALSSDCRELLKCDPCTILSCDVEKCQALVEGAPKPMNFLSEQSRNHFREVLEFSEKLKIPYKINHCLVGSRALVTHTVFEILETDETGKTLSRATGFRYNGLIKKLGSRRDVPSVGISIENITLPKSTVKKSKGTIRGLELYFIQLGFEAKLKSLAVIETLRQSGIPMLQSLSRDKLSSQLAIAEELKIPYTIIMGQKEAMENSVIVRSMATRSQETVPWEKLPEYLKKLKKKK